ncbi:MAG: S8 family serine peptidase [Armatimonadota bacterium]
MKNILIQNTSSAVSARPNKAQRNATFGSLATIVGIAVIASISSPVFAAPTHAEDSKAAETVLAPSALEKLAPELREAVANHRVLPQDFLKTGKAGVAGTVPAPGTMRVMVRTSGLLSSRATRLRIAQSGAKLGRTFVKTGTQVLDATAEQLAVLAADSTVLSISPDSPTASTAAKLDVNSTSIGVPEVARVAQHLNRSSANGRGITVAVLDSGVAPVGDLAGRIVGFKDFVNGASSVPYDDYGHGTHVAGIVAGSGASSTGSGATRTYRGIAYGANIVGAKVLGATGQGTVSDAIAGIEWCIENKAAYNIRVINLSLGTKVRESYKTDPLCQAAERAVAAGIVVVATAGNRGKYNTINSPGNDPAVITVGASNTNETARRSDDVITSYTSRGPSAIDATMKPDLVAPGNRVVSLRAPGSWIDTNQPQTNVPAGEYLKHSGETAYARISGSSMAAPAVAGAAAILLQANPQMTPSGVKAALMVSAQLLSGKDPLKGTTGAYDPFTQGAGELNLPGALNIALHYQSGVGVVGTPHTTSQIAGERFRWSLVTLRHRWRLRDASPTTLLSGSARWASLGAGSVWNDELIWGGSITLQNGNGIVTITNAAWGTSGDNASWNTGGDAPSLTDGNPAFSAPEEDNASWNTGGDNASWNTGGDAPSWAEDSPSESAFAAPEEDNASWNTGGDNASWNTGGDAPVSMLLIADNASWNTGGDAPFSIADGDPVAEDPEEDNASWNTGGDSPAITNEEEEDNASWNTGGD